MFRIHLQLEPPTNYRSVMLTAVQTKAHKLLLDHLFDSGFLMIETCSGTLSTAMTKVEIDRFSQTVLDGMRKLRHLI